MVEVISRKKYGKEPLLLDEKVFFDCEFRETILIYTGGDIPSFEKCLFDSVHFNFQGGASNTLQFIQALYHAGFKEKIEKTFEAIRNWEPDPSRISGNKEILRDSDEERNKG